MDESAGIGTDGLADFAGSGAEEVMRELVSPKRGLV
jgi:hypothetical protein